MYKHLGAYIQWGVLTDGFWCYEFEGLIHGGAYFRNFTVCSIQLSSSMAIQNNKQESTLIHF